MFLAFAGAFAISYYGVKSYVIADVERDFMTAAQQMNREYLGESIPHDGLQLPERLLQEVETRFPGFHIGLVEMENLPDGWVYKVVGSTGTEQLEIFAAPPNRTLVAKRKPMSAIYHDMQAALSSRATRNLNLLLFSSSGRVLAGTPLPGYTAEWILDEISGVEDPLVEPVVFRADGVWVSAVELFDGNVMCLISKENRVAQVTRFLSGFFVVLALLFLPLTIWVGFDISRRAMAGVERVAATASLVGNGHLDARVVAGHEGSEIEKLATDFNGMVVRIETLMRELQDVTVNIVHDLRTPLARIRGLLESMGWEEVNPDERGLALAAAMEECDRIVPLIDSILELAKAESGMLMLQTESFDLVADIRMAHDIFSSLAEERHVDFLCEVPASEVMILGDRGRMQRVIANLIDNALKFTPEGGAVEVALKVDREQAVLTVKDTGTGIPAADLERVFERFYRADSSRTTKGHGLGLSLVKAFVAAMSGTVEIESGEGRGCLVRVCLPQERA